MKISYKVLQKYITNIKTPEEVAQDLIMHTAEVEDILLEWENLEHVFVWEVLSCEKHPDSHKLNCTIVKVKDWIFPIVCWASNVKAWIRVPVAICWAKLSPDFVITKTKIRWQTSEWMICSEDELWLKKERQEGILELPIDAPLNMSLRDYLWKNDAILEIDNKAINHRPDLFSHIWIIREIYAINWEKFDYEYKNKDFSKLKNLWIENEIQDVVKRYIWLKIENVSNTQTPNYIKKVLNSAEINSKWLLIDISNYSLYLYWQPTHCFDADKIKWNIVIRYAKDWEEFLALDDNEYKLSSNDIVIADREKILALWGIIWWKDSSVTDKTKNIIVEWAHFNQAVIRKTWKRLWIRTDSLNVFEKDIIPEMAIRGVSLIAEELDKNLKSIKITWYSDIYNDKHKTIKIPFDLEYINNLIGKKYLKEDVIKILENLWINIEKTWKKENLIIPFWRKDLNYKSDIAEEIARIDWYNNIESTIPKINNWAIIQDNIYKIKNDSRKFFIDIWFYDIYTYSFVSQDLMSKVLWKTDTLVSMKNPLSEELTHLRWSLIPNLLLSINNNINNFDNLKIFEIEKVFNKNGNEINENYYLSWLVLSKNEIIYYYLQNIVSKFFKNIWVDKFVYENPKNIPSFAHSWRTSSIIIRWQEIWYVWEIKPKVSNNFEIEERIWFFEINIEKIEKVVYKIIKSKNISSFQENNFDLSFVIDKDIKIRDIKTTIEKSNQNLITKVDLLDIYENEEKLKWKKSISFKIYIQSMERTLDDKDKNEIIKEIINKVEKKGWKLRM